MWTLKTKIKAKTPYTYSMDVHNRGSIILGTRFSVTFGYTLYVSGESSSVPTSIQIITVFLLSKQVGVYLLAGSISPSIHPSPSKVGISSKHKIVGEVFSEVKFWKDILFGSLSSNAPRYLVVDFHWDSSNEQSNLFSLAGSIPSTIFHIG